MTKRCCFTSDGLRFSIAVRQALAFAAFVLFNFAVSVTVDAQQAPVPSVPSGWETEKVAGKRPRIEFNKTGLRSPDLMSVKFYDRELLVDQTIRQWVVKRLMSGRAPLGGEWTGPIEKLTRQTKNFYTAERPFEVNNVKHVIVVNAVCVDKLNIRMAAVIKSLTNETRKHELAASRLMYRLVRVEIDSAKADERGLDLEQSLSLIHI